MSIPMTRVAAFVIPVLAVCGCASFTAPATFGLNHGAATLVRQVCTDIMGLREGLAEFDVCGDSLAESVRALQDADLIARAHEHCEGKGLADGTAALAKCVVVAKREVGLQASADLPPATVSEAPSRSRSVRMTLSQQDESMELSCAHLGLHPASGVFKQCVGSLKVALLGVRNPL